MDTVQRFKNALKFQKVDRLPMIEWATWWTETIQRWYKEGLPAQCESPDQISDHLALDSLKQFWLCPLGPSCPSPEHHGAPILTSSDDYNQFKQKGYIFPSAAFDRDELMEWNHKMQSGQTVIWFTFEGFFWFPRTLFGIENHMYAFYDHPELMHEINQDLASYYLDQLDRITEIAAPVFMTFAEDMSYNHGPMLSREQFDEFLAPYYTQIIPKVKQLGIKVFVDSDGDVKPLIPWLKSVGVEGILPLERMAGVDVAEIRRDHPNFLMIGGFDKTVMHKGENALRQEFERLLPTMKTGGFIPSVDHQTPPGVSLKNYSQYLELYLEYTQRAAQSQQLEGTLT